MIHLPILRAGRPYLSKRRAVVNDVRTAEPVVEVSLATGGSASPPEPVPAETPNLDERVAQLEAELSSRTTISASSRQARGDSGVTEVGEASAEQMEAIMARRVMAAARTKGWDGEEGEASEEFLEEVGRMVRDEMKQARE